MHKARTRAERCQQILNWLQEERPCGRPVTIRWVRWTGARTKQDYGCTDRSGGSLVISLNTRKCSTWDAAIETLIHEYAHCRLWGMAQVERSDKISAHDASFWAEFGTIYNMFHYSRGWVCSKRYGLKRVSPATVTSEM